MLWLPGHVEHNIFKYNFGRLWVLLVSTQLWTRQGMKTWQRRVKREWKKRRENRWKNNSNGKTQRNDAWDDVEEVNVIKVRNGFLTWWLWGGSWGNFGNISLVGDHIKPLWEYRSRNCSHLQAPKNHHFLRTIKTFTFIGNNISIHNATCICCTFLVPTFPSAHLYNFTITFTKGKVIYGGSIVCHCNQPVSKINNYNSFLIWHQFRR